MERLLAERWSRSRSRIDYGSIILRSGDARSHETIVQARGALRKELTASLRTGRPRRRPNQRHVGAIWAMLRADGIHVSRITVERALRRRDLLLPTPWGSETPIRSRSASVVLVCLIDAV